MRLALESSAEQVASHSDGCLRFNDRYINLARILCRDKAHARNLFAVVQVPCHTRPGTDDTFEWATHPLSAFEPARDSDVPDYLFGDAALAEGTSGTDEASSRVPRVRLQFDLEPKASQEDEDDEDERAAAKAKSKRGRPKWSAEPKQHLFKLSFNKRSNDRAYDPAGVQHFSPPLQQ